MGQDTSIQCIDRWPKHPGWKRWLFRVWDARTRNRVSKAFDDGDKPAGWIWAEDQRAKLQLGVVSAGVLPFAGVGQRYVDDITGAGRKPSYIAEVQRLVAAAVAAGAVNMRDDGFALKVRDWLISAPCFFTEAETLRQRAEERLARSRERLAKAEENAKAPGDARHPRVAAKRLATAEARCRKDEARLAAAVAAKAEVRAPSPRTKNRWLVILKSVARCAVKHYGLASNPLTAIKPFKAPKTVRNPMRVEELRRMVADERAADAYFRKACLLVYAGLRDEEASHVRWPWINFEAKTITLRIIRDAKGQILWAPKGDKERIVPLLDELEQLLVAWRAAAGGSPTGWVVDDASAREPEDEVTGNWTAFREYLGRCGIDAADRDLSPHDTRHTWASIRLATGVSPNRLRREMGHAKLDTTDIYADAEATFEQVVKDWPKGQMRLRSAIAAPPATASAFVLDCSADLGGFIAQHVLAKTLDQVAVRSGVPVATLRAWFVDGVPESVRQYVAALAASAAIHASAAPLSPLPLMAAASRLAAPSTAPGVSP